MDRTYWKQSQTNINILMLALSWNGKGLPIFWKLMDKRGNFNFEETRELQKKYKEVFPNLKLAVLVADMGLIDKKWFMELNKNGNSILYKSKE